MSHYHSDISSQEEEQQQFSHIPQFFMPLTLLQLGDGMYYIMQCMMGMGMGGHTAYGIPHTLTTTYSSNGT
jgi:6-phosphogluconolactonase/glucosamine-6-phosphate isomerase/deaminase